MRNRVLAVVALVLAFLLGLAMGGATSDPTASPEYQELEREFTQTRTALLAAQDEVTELSESQLVALQEAEDAQSEAASIESAVEARQAELDEREGELDTRATELDERDAFLEEARLEIEAREEAVAAAEAAAARGPSQPDSPESSGTSDTSDSPAAHFEMHTSRTVPRPAPRVLPRSASAMPVMADISTGTGTAWVASSRSGSGAFPALCCPNAYRLGCSSAQPVSSDETAP